MNIENSLELIKDELYNKKLPHLNKIEKIIIRSVWLEKSYADIAKDTHYQPKTVKNAGSILWKKLSEAFGEDVNQHNLKQVLKNWRNKTNHIHHNQVISLNLNGADLTRASITLANLSESRQFSDGSASQKDLQNPQSETKKLETTKENYCYYNIKFNSQTEVIIAKTLEAMKITFSPYWEKTLNNSEFASQLPISFLIISQGKCGLLKIITNLESNNNLDNIYLESNYGNLDIPFVCNYNEIDCEKTPEIVIKDFLEKLHSI